jgi:serine protease Do/serine protease DegQ
MARAVMEQLIRYGEVKRGRLGAAAQDVAGTEGAVVSEVQTGSPAEQAGLRKGDVVTGLNGRPVRGGAELRARLSVVPVGETVELRVQRGSETQALNARIGELEKTRSAGGRAIVELAGAELSDAQRQGGRRERVVLVTAVDPGSEAFQHGLREGDIIFAVNQRRVTTVPTLVKALRARGALALNVVRGETILAIPIR